MAFKLTLVADVRSWLKGTTDVEKSLDDISESLDELAKDTAQDADKAADALAHEFSDAYDKVKAESKSAGKKIGDDLHDGTRKAGEGVDELRDEAKQSAKETAASFSDVSDALDLVQEIAANAFVGFGPAGMAAGAAAAIGIGLLKTALDAAKEKADEAKEQALSLADAVADVGGDPRAINWAEQLRDTMKQIVDTKEWFEFWQSAPVDRLTDWTAKAEQFGVTMGTAAKAATGDQEALADVTDHLNAKIAELNKAYLESGKVTVDGISNNVHMDESLRAAADSATKFRDDITAQGKIVQDATAWQRAYADATDDLSAAQSEAQKTSQEWASNLTDHLSVADEGLGGFVKDSKTSWAEWNKSLKEARKEGTLDIDAWAREVKERAKEVKRIEGFEITVLPKLSPEAQEAFAKLPTETQSQIVKAYNDGDKGDKRKIKQTLEAEAKVNVSTVTVETKDIPKVEIPSTVATSGLDTETQKAANVAQSEADKEGNRIEFNTKIDRDELQRQVNRAAASITPPTITVRVKVPKEVP